MKDKIIDKKFPKKTTTTLYNKPIPKLLRPIETKIKNMKKDIKTIKTPAPFSFRNESQEGGRIDTKEKDYKDRDKEDLLINSLSTRDPKSVSNKPIKPQPIAFDFFKDDYEDVLLKNEDSELTKQDIFKAENITGEILSRNNSKFYPKVRVESDTSNFLNFNLGDTKNLTLYEDTLLGVGVDKKDNTILTNINTNILQKIEETQHISDSELSYGDVEDVDDLGLSEFNINKQLYYHRDECELEISGITKYRLSDKKLSNLNVIIAAKRQSNKLANISILSSDSLDIFEHNSTLHNQNNTSIYCSDINEFDDQQEKNKIYKMNIKENYRKSHLDIINLNFLLRCLFHKSEILTDVS
jgi:hypothetical protein